MNDLARRGVTALVVAVVAVAIARLIAGTFRTIPVGVDPMQWGPILTVTGIAAVSATIVYALLDRFTANPRRNFLVVAGLAFLFMLTPLLTVAPTLPGATTTLLWACSRSTSSSRSPSWCRWSGNDPSPERSKRLLPCPSLSE